MDQRKLPDSILLEIIQLGPVSTIKNFRLTCRHLCALITKYETSISSALARQYFQYDIKIFKYYSSPVLDLKSIFGVEIRRQQALRLAGILLEQPHYWDWEYFTIAAVDPAGNEIRSRIMNGFAVLWHFADIAHDIKNDGLPTVRGAVESSQPCYVKRIFELWNQLAQNMSLGYKLDYQFLRFFLNNAFSSQAFEDPRKDRLEIGTGTDYCNNDSWVSWLIFCSGPKFFQKAWSSPIEEKECREYVWDHWVQKSYNERLWEYRAGRETEVSLGGFDTKIRLRAEDEAINLLEAESETERIGDCKEINIRLGYSIIGRRESEYEKEFNDPYQWPPRLQNVEPTRKQIGLRDGEPGYGEAIEPSELANIRAELAKWNKIIPPPELNRTTTSAHTLELSHDSDDG